MHTTDGGATWEHVLPLGTFGRITDAQVMATGKAWALHRQPDKLRRSENFFQTSVVNDLPVNHTWHQVEFGSETAGWIGGFYGGLRRTTDGGASFVDEPLPGFQYGGVDLLMHVVAPRADEAYVLSVRTGAIEQGIIYHTVDGGITWDSLPAMTDPTHFASGGVVQMDVLPTGEIWAAGSYGHIYASAIPEVLLPGDIDGDGDVDYIDRDLFVAVLMGADADPDHELRSDLNGDGVADGEDISPFVIALLTD